jgi:hypothetical protein
MHWVFWNLFCAFSRRRFLLPDLPCSASDTFVLRLRHFGYGNRPGILAWKS